MKRLLLLFAALVFLAIPKNVSAQMYTANSYYTFGTDGTYLYSDAVVDGQLNISAPPGAMHTYHNISHLGTAGAVEYSGGPSRGYVFVQNPQEVEPTDGEIVSFSDQESVDCNMMGQVYYEYTNIQFEIAYERTASLGVRTGCIYNAETGVTSCEISQTPWCNPAGSPPDLNVISIFQEVSPTSPPPFSENWGACYREASGHPWACTQALSIGVFNGTLGLGFCTKTP
jgi:hypothetical protein